MGVLADAKHILQIQDDFFTAIKAGDIRTVRKLIAENTYKGVLNPHLDILEAGCDAIRNKVRTTTVLKILNLLCACAPPDEKCVERWLDYAIGSKKSKLVEWLLTKHPSADFSNTIANYLYRDSVDILALLLARTTRFDVARSIERFTHANVARVWLPYLTQEQIDQALILSATNCAPESVALFAPLCSETVCQTAIFFALKSERNGAACIEVLAPFVKTLTLYGGYTGPEKFKYSRSVAAMAVLSPILDAHRWNWLAMMYMKFADLEHYFYARSNPYQIQGLASILQNPGGPYLWSRAIKEDEETADTARGEQLRQMKTDAQPVLDFVQAVKDGNSSYIASAEVDQNTIDSAFLMSLLWNNESPKHVLRRGVCDETMWAALLEAIERKSPHLSWLIDQYEYAQCPKRKIYAPILGQKLLTQRLFDEYIRLSAVFSHLDTDAKALPFVYNRRVKAVATVLKTASPTFRILDWILFRGRYRLMKSLIAHHPNFDYQSVIEKNIQNLKCGNAIGRQKKVKILTMLCLHQVKNYPEHLENLLHTSIKGACPEVVSCLLPLADNTVRATLFVTAAEENFEFSTFFSRSYPQDIYTQAMVNAARRGYNQCVDQLWEYTDVDQVHRCIRDNGLTHINMLYFYERLDEHHLRQNLRRLLMQASGEEHHQGIRRL